MIEVNNNNNNNNTTTTHSNRDVAIVGCGLRLPGNSNNPKQLWENLLKDCFDGIVETKDRWSDSFADMSEISSKFAGLIELNENWMSFDPLFFGILPSDAKEMDPQHRLLLKTTWEAFEDAQIDPLSLRGSDTSVYIGCSSMDYAAVNCDPIKKSLNCFNQTLSGASNRISYCFDLRGTSLTIDTACSSSLNAVTLGYESIVNGKSNYSIVGGCNFIINPQQSRSFTSVNVIGKSGRCKSFDQDCDGFVRSEGSVVFILKNLEMAIKDGNQIYSVIKGSSSNVDGTLNKTNYFAPSKNAQTNNIRKAFESTNGDLNPSDIDFFEAHGTGTQIGDPIEVEAIANVFKDYKPQDQPLLIGSIKSNIGHLEPASGVASLAKVCLMFKNRQFVKNIHFNKPNPNIKFEEWKIKVCTETTPFPIKPPGKKVSIAINSFGITGSNACLLLSEYIKPTTTTTTTTTTQDLSNDKIYLIPISLNSKLSLDEYKNQLINQAKELSNLINFKDFINYHIHSKATRLASRSVLMGNCWDHVVEDLFTTTKSNKSGNIIKDNNKQPTLVFVFPGQGNQYSEMGLQLYENEPIFKQSMDKIDLIFSKYFGYSILKKLREIKQDDEITINLLEIAQPSIFMIQISLYEYYKSSWGIVPSILVGHSFGEIAASFCSGMIDLETSCFIIYKRAIIQNKTIGSGKMLAIGLGEKDYLNQFSSKYPNIEISCFNSPTSIVISGNEIELLEISNTLKEKSIFQFMLSSPSSFHSSKQDIIKDEFISQTNSINATSKPWSIPIFSTVSSNLFEKSINTLNSNYLYSNLREPVLFEKTILNIFKYIELNDLGSQVLFLELSPSPTLTNYINEMVTNVVTVNSNYFFIEDDSISILSSLNKKNVSNEQYEIYKTISQLYCNGYNVDFKNQLSNYKDVKEFTSHLLPRYQWDESIYFKMGRIINQRTQGPSINQLGNLNESSPFISYTSYIDIKEEPFQFLSNHQSRGRVLFAGNSYIDNVLKIFPQQDITFHNFEFKSQLVLRPGVKQCITTNIYQSAKNEYRVTFHYQDTVSGKWIQSCHGRFTLVKHNIDQQTQKLDIESIKSSDKVNWITMKRKELYEAIKIKTNLSLTNQFQSVEEAQYGDGCCLAKISLGQDTTLSSYDVESFLNICTIDGGFQVWGVLRDCPDIVVLDKIELLRFYSENIPVSASFRDQYKFLYCYTEYIRSIGNSVFANITVTLPDGTILFNTPKVVFTSISSRMKVNNLIENPDHQLYSTCIQSIESIPIPKSIDNNLFLKLVPTTTATKKAFTTCLFSNFKKKFQSITPALIRDSTIQYLIDTFLKVGEFDSTSKKNLAISMFEMFKINNSLIEYSAQPKLIKLLSTKHIETMNKISNILLTETSPSSVEPPASLLLSTRPEINQITLINEIILNTIKPLINQKIVFRILELGAGIGDLTQLIVDKLNSILQLNPLAEIDIEYTFSDDKDTNASFIKNKLTNILESVVNQDTTTKDLSSRKPSLIFKLIDLNDKELISSKLINPSYYDIVILNHLNNYNNELITQSIKTIYEILNPNGYLILIDTLFKPKTTDLEFELLQQWLSFNYIGSGNNTISNWNKLLIQDFKFINLISTSSEPWVILVQKPSFNNLLPSPTTVMETISNYDQIIVFGKIDNVDDTTTTAIMDINEQGTDIYMIHTIEEFEEQVNKIPLTDKSVILFTSTVNDVILDNFKEITLDYIKINQYLLKNEIGAKHILVTKNSNSTNALSASVVGSFRYFCEFQQLNLYLMDFDESIFEKSLDFVNILHELTDSNKHVQREFIFKGDTINYERVTQESNLKSRYNSTSFVTDKQGLYVKLNQNLQYQLKALDNSIPPDHVEIKVYASGLNFKDSLVYRRLVPPEAVNHLGIVDDPEFGFECSGVVTRVGQGVTKFKVGDEVVAIGFNCTASHVVLRQYRFYLKPSNLSHVEAASIPVVYLTSYYSLFISGYLSIEKKESVLIHGASGGIGLACLSLLKAKNFNGLLFVTVGSKEKENYLKNTYGNFITGIYSSKNTEYLLEIKKTIQKVTGNNQIFKEFGIAYHGIDLIINTLNSTEFMDANFNSLCQGGRIVDLSVTHLTSQDTTDFNKFKYNIGYSTVELLVTGFERNKLILNEIMDMFVNENLSLLPIKEFPVSQIKDAIEYINERKHIGKIVINHQNQDLLESTLTSNDNEFYKDYLIPNPDYKISNNCNLGSTILITGQTGLSISIINWIISFNSIENPVESIIILSLSPIKYELEYLIKFYKFNNNNSGGKLINFHFRQVDISNFDDLTNVINQLYEKETTLKKVSSIFHNAFAPSECDALEIDMNHLIKSHGAKTIGAFNLHQLSCNLWNDSLVNFVLSSSITSVIGSTRQCGYIAANCVLDSISSLRNSFGLPCTTIKWGVLGSAGFVSRNDNISRLFEYQGLNPISINMVNGTFDLLLQNKNNACGAGKIIASFNYSNVFNAFKFHNLSYKLDYFLNPVLAKSFIQDDDELSIRDEIISKFSEILSTEPSKLALDIKLIDYGANSILVVELKNWIDRTFAPNILTIVQIQNVTINQLIQLIQNACSKLKIRKSFKKKSSSSTTAGGSKNVEINWSNEIKLNPTIRPSNDLIENYKKTINQIYQNASQQDCGLTVLLIGECSFIGINLLVNLIESSRVKSVYVISNGNSKDDVLANITTTLKAHYLNGSISTLEFSKIQPMVGDFTKDLFGLSNHLEYNELSKRIDLIINTASNTTKQYCAHLKYQDADKSYLAGVDNILKFASVGKLKRFVQMSTMGRHSSDPKREKLDEYSFPELDDDSFFNDQNKIVSGWIQAKIVAEYHIKEAANRGIPCCILRIPFTFPSETGVGREVDFIQLFLQSCYVMSSYPAGPIDGLPLYSSPVNWYSKNFCFLSIGSDKFPNGCWDGLKSSPIPNLVCFDLFGVGVNFGDLIKDLSNTFSWRELSFIQYIKKADTYDDLCCKRLSGFINNQEDFLRNVEMPGQYKLNEFIKSLLISNNSYDGWEITKTLIIKHLEWAFKKKIL